MNKKERIGALVTVVWGIIAYLIAQEMVLGGQLVFTVIWVLPVVIGWGVYWVKRSRD